MMNLRPVSIRSLDGRARVGFTSVIAMGLFLAGCANRPTDSVLEPVRVAASDARSVEFLVATTRKASPFRSAVFTADRTSGLSYAAYAVSVPKSHKPGDIEYPGSPPDPSNSFVVTRAQTLNASAFTRALSTSGQSDALVFIHGYNTSYPESVFRFAQLIHDASARAGHVAVLFAWPSRGELGGYLTDKESVTFSRNYLEETLNQIARTPGIRNIEIVAHSMGNWLAMETLRQARLRSSSPFLAKLRNVMLIAPDIDVDVFKTQMDTIGRLREPITVVVNKHDLALAASQRLSGGISRVGNVLLDKPEVGAAISKYALRVVDLSEVQGDDQLKHSTFIKALPALDGMIQSHALSGSPQTTGPHVLAADAAGRLLTAPLQFGKAIIGSD